MPPFLGQVPLHLIAGLPLAAMIKEKEIIFAGKGPVVSFKRILTLHENYTQFSNLSTAADSANFEKSVRPAVSTSFQKGKALGKSQ